MTAPLRKAVFPVAGLGTRFLPATKSMPKEMLTLVDRPLIQYVVEEARAAGIEQFIFVTSANKSALEDHFDTSYELEATLKQRGKTQALEELEKLMPEAGQVSSVRQQKPLGLGHAVWCARHLVGDEPFAVVLPDMIMQGEPSCLSQMAAVYNETGGNVIAVSECDPAETAKYGIVGVGAPVGSDGNAFQLEGMVEKPAPEEAPSNLYISGRYILQPQIFDLLGRQKKGAGNEIQLTDAMMTLADEQPFYGCRFTGRTHDCGDKLGFLVANVAYGLKRPDLADDLRQELHALLDD